MRIVCDNCRTAYEIDDSDPVLVQQTRNMRFRCGACGQFVVVSALASNEAGHAQPLPSVDEAQHGAARETSEPAPLLQLKQAGKVYNIRDLATLQRWIVERRVVREDLITVNGLQWEPVGSIPELAAFFLVVEQADRVFAMDSIGTMPPVSPSPPTAGGGPDDWQPWHRQTDDAGIGSTSALDGEPQQIETSEASTAEDDTGLADSGVPAGLPVDGGPLLPFSRETAAEDDISDQLVDATDAPEPSLPNAVPAGLPPIEMMPASTSEPMAPVLAAAPSPKGAVDEDLRMLEEWSEDASEATVKVFYDDNASTVGSSSGALLDADLEADWAPRRRSAGWILPAVLLVAAIALAAWWWSGHRELAAPDAGSVVAEAAPLEDAAAPTGDGWAGSDPTADAAAADDGTTDDGTTDDGTADDGTTDDGSVAAARSGPSKSTGGSASDGSTADAPSTASKESSVAPTSAPAATSTSAPSSQPREASVKTLLDRGWSAVSRENYSVARTEFDQASRKAPGNADAWYGLGYAEDKLGRSDSARGHYCKARQMTTPQSETGREVAGRLRVNDMTCD